MNRCFWELSSTVAYMAVLYFGWFGDSFSFFMLNVSLMSFGLLNLYERTIVK